MSNIRLVSYSSSDVHVPGTAERRIHVNFYGIDENGVNYVIKVFDFEPFLYVRLDTACNEDVQRFVSFAREMIGNDELKGGELVHSHNLYGFDNNRKHTFIRLTFSTENAFRKTKQLWYSDDKMHSNGIAFGERRAYLYEAHIPPILRLFHMKDIRPASWITIPTPKLTRSTDTACNFEATLMLSDIVSSDVDTRAPYKICSFDIEASSSDGEFPLAKKTFKRLAVKIFDNAIEETLTASNITDMVADALTKIRLKGQPAHRWRESLHRLLNRPPPTSTSQRSYEIDDNDDVEEIDDVEEQPRRTPWNFGRTFLPKRKTVIECINSGCDLNKHQRDSIIDVLDACIAQSIRTGVEGDMVTFIGSVFFRFGEKTAYLNHCIVLGDCAPIDGVQVVTCDTEREVLLAWTKLIHEQQPNALIGYNIFGFDWRFLYERACETRCEKQFMKLSCVNSQVCKLLNKQIKLASGEYDLYYPNITGRVQFDLYMIMRREYNLSSYKLDDVAAHFIGDFVSRVTVDDNTTVVQTRDTYGLYKDSYIRFEIIEHSSTMYEDGKKLKVKSLTETSFVLEGAHSTIATIAGHNRVRWGLAKDDVTPKQIFTLARGDQHDRAVVAKYCVQDCRLPMHIFNKVDMMTTAIEMADLCSVPMEYVLIRGQGIKLLSFIAKKCYQANVRMPTMPKCESYEGYMGAIVLDPKCDLYLADPIACLDYGSLYPSCMISENISHDTLVMSCERNMSDEVVAYTGDEAYNNLPGREYVDIEYDTYMWTKQESGKMLKKQVGTKSCRFVQPMPDGSGVGILPRILKELLSARKATRKRAAETSDPFMKNILDKRQLSIKICANSIYGVTGAKTSAFYAIDVAASTTATGRALLMTAKTMVEADFGNGRQYETSLGLVGAHADCVYGDTDSVFVAFRPTLDDVALQGKDALKASIELGNLAGAAITRTLKSPHDLEYEKTFFPLCLLSKKKYVGKMYENDVDKWSSKSMGIVLKRRDNAPIVKDIYGGVIDILMQKQDIGEAVQFLNAQLANISTCPIVSWS